jgi:N-ethylmaleimide reductase
MSEKLFSEFKLGQVTLKNRVVMAPMTRSRAIGNIPNELMAEYYAQRAEAGLIITEGVSPSRNGLGYARIPGAYNVTQTAGWKKVADAVHANDGKIFMQLMHTGRVSHPDNMPKDARVLAPSAITLEGQMYTETNGMQDHPKPEAMTADDIETAIEEYVSASKNAIEAGFDGVELHGANGYLIDQFLNLASNLRTDEWGGSPENRNRFAVEVARRTALAIGGDKVGIRVSPNGAFNGLAPFEGNKEQYASLAAELKKVGIVYIHIVDHSSMGAPEVGEDIKGAIRAGFAGTIIVSGGLDKDLAEKALQEGKGELAAFGKPFISNPDLVTRMKEGIELAAFDHTTFYTPGEKGYTDYAFAEVGVN